MNLFYGLLNLEYPQVLFDVVSIKVLLMSWIAVQEVDLGKSLINKSVFADIEKRAFDFTTRDKSPEKQEAMADSSTGNGE